MKRTRESQQFRRAFPSAEILASYLFAPALITRQSFKRMQGRRRKSGTAERNKVARERSLNTSVAKVLYKRFALRERVSDERMWRRGIISSHDEILPVNSLVAHLPLLFSKRRENWKRLEATGSDRRGARQRPGREASRTGRDPLRSLKRARGSSGIHE